MWTKTEASKSTDKQTVETTSHPVGTEKHHNKLRSLASEPKGEKSEISLLEMIIVMTTPGPCLNDESEPMSLFYFIFFFQ